MQKVSSKGKIREMGWFGKILVSILGSEKSLQKGKIWELIWWGPHLKIVVCRAHKKIVINKKLKKKIQHNNN